MMLKTVNGKLAFSFVEDMDKFGAKETREIRDFIGKDVEEYLDRFFEKKLFMKVMSLNIEDAGKERTVFLIAPNAMLNMLSGGQYKVMLRAGGVPGRVIINSGKGKKFVFKDDMLEGFAKESGTEPLDWEIKSRLADKALERLNTGFNFARNLKPRVTELKEGKVSEREVKPPCKAVVVDRIGRLVFSNKALPRK